MPRCFRLSPPLYNIYNCVRALHVTQSNELVFHIIYYSRFFMSSSPDSASQPTGTASSWLSLPNFITSRMPGSKARSNKPQDGFRTGTGVPSAHENRETALSQQIVNLMDQVRQLHDQVQALQQGQDFRSHFKDSGIPHDKIQQQLSTMEVEIQGWARMALRDSDWKSPDGKFPAAVHLQQGQFPNFKSALWRICHDDMKPDFLQQISSTDLLAAIASCIIVEQAVMNPLGPCTRKFEGDVNSDVYKVMSNGEASLGGYLLGLVFFPSLLFSLARVDTLDNSEPTISQGMAGCLPEAL